MVHAVPHSLREIKDSLLDAGFANITAFVKRLQKQVPDLSILACGQVYGSAIIDQVKQRGGIESEPIVAAITGQYRWEFGSEPATIPLQAILICAEKPS